MGGLSLNYLTLIVAVINLIFGVVVLRSDPKNKLNIYFFIFTLILAAWAATNFYFLQFSTTITLFRATYATGGLALVTALPWVFILVKKQYTKLLNWLFYVLAVAVVTLPFFNRLIVSNILFLPEGIEFVSGPLFDLYGALLLITLFYLLYVLIIGYRKNTGKEKAQIGYTLAGISFFAFISFMFGVILPLFNISPVVAFDAQSSLIWVGLTTYAITRHGLFNIKVIATQIFVVLLLVLILSRILNSIELTDIIFESIVLVLVAITGYFLTRSVQSEVKRREEVERLAKEKTEAFDELEERNRNLATLQKISDIVLNENDMKTMTQKILDELPNQLDGCIGGVLSLVKKGQLMGYSMSSNNFSKKIISLVGADLEKYSVPIKKDYNLIHRSIVERKSIDSDKLADFISPPIPKAVALSIQKVVGARHIEAFPLVAGGEPFGVMLFVFSKTKEDIHTKNYSIAKAISDDLSLAVQRAQAFAQLKEANEYLSQLDKMKDEFISMASHELNTPLAAIEGYLSMILDEGMGKIDKQSRVYLSRAYSSSKRLAELILDLLNVSRVEQGRLKMKYSKANLAELAQSVIHELQIKTDAKKIYMKLKADKNVPEIWCDPDRIREVIVNLAGNAIKFTEKGGITIKISKTDKKVLIAVADTGRGIAKADQDKLFQKFSQIKREVDEHQGTGLGLYISKNFVELHKGKLWVTSDAGKGATFSFELPIISKPPREVEGAILEKSVKSTQIETPKKNAVPKIITDSVKGRF